MRLTKNVNLWPRITFIICVLAGTVPYLRLKFSSFGSTIEKLRSFF